MRSVPILLAIVGLASCASGPRSPVLNAGLDPFEIESASSENATLYRIGPSDKLALAVFQVPELSFNEIYVDASGYLQLPLVGAIRAAGLTPSELSQELQRRLGERYLRDPEVMVAVSEAASQKITIDGAVTKPGVYKMQGRTTLIQAVAMAEGPNDVADVERVAVFRTVDGRRMAAVFDLRALRTGEVEDPVLRGDDIVIVDTSRLSGAMREVLRALPSLAIFAYI